MAAKKSSSRKSSAKSTSTIPKLEVDNNSSINVRKIENGFVVSESGYTGKGRNANYYNKEYFSKTNPVAGITKGGGSGVKFGGRK